MNGKKARLIRHTLIQEVDERPEWGAQILPKIKCVYRILKKKYMESNAKKRHHLSQHMQTTVGRLHGHDLL